MRVLKEKTKNLSLQQDNVMTMYEVLSDEKKGEGDWSGGREREEESKGKLVDGSSVVSHFVAYCKKAVNLSGERRPSRR